MGIYDREYYRREGPSFLDSLAIHGRVCRWLIFINVAVFIIQILSRQASVPGSSFTDWLDLSWQDVRQGQVWRLVTYAFLHDTETPFHIIMNMLALWWFGSDVEDLYGPREFLALYLVAAIVAGVGFIATTPGAVVGASGAVVAVLVVCAMHFPTRTVWLYLLPMPIWLMVTLFVVWDAYVFLNDNRTNVAVTAHLAGAAFGFLYYKAGIRITSFAPRMPEWSGLKKQLSRPRLRVYREDARDAGERVSVAAPAPVSAEVDEQLEAKLDAVLEKVARHGQSSLTETERQTLFRASEIYKRRRLT